MGSTYAQILVRLNGQEAETVTNSLKLRLCAHLGAQGYRELPAAPCDREIAFNYRKLSRWLCVTDSKLACGDRHAFDELGALLTKGDAVSAIGVSVYDSDLLELHLFRKSKPRAYLSNWPGYFRGEPRCVLPLVDRLEEWETQAPGFREFVTDKTAWSPPLAEEILRRMAPLFGWDLDLPAEDATVLRLCLHAKANVSFVESPSPQLPLFEHVGGSQRTILRTGSPCNISIVAHNVGAESTGLFFVIWGPALDRDLVKVTDATLHIGAPFQGVTQSATFASSPGPEGTVHTAIFPDAFLPSGPRNAAAAFASTNFRSGYDGWLRARVEASAVVFGNLPGKADLHLAILSSSTPDQSQTSWKVTLQITP